MADQVINVSDVLQGFLYDQITNLTNIDFFNRVVQFDDDPNSVASAEASFVFSGPPVLGNGAIKGKSIVDYLKPIGAIQNYSLNEGKQIIPFKELGSRLPRQAIGSGEYGAQLSRVLTRYCNLNYALYQWLYKYMMDIHGHANLELAVLPGAKGDRHWTNLESEVFQIPFGMLIITGTAGGEFVHIEYLERCIIQGGGNARTAGQSIITDNASIAVTRPIPFVHEDGTNILRPEQIRLKSNPKVYAFPSPDRAVAA